MQIKLNGITQRAIPFGVEPEYPGQKGRKIKKYGYKVAVTGYYTITTPRFGGLKATLFRVRGEIYRASEGLTIDFLED